jgi:hypothetical protein
MYLIYYKEKNQTFNSRYGYKLTVMDKFIYLENKKELFYEKYQVY